MKRTFKHIVITRFNVPFDCNCHLDNEWIGRRFDLCDALCFPSLQGQTIRNFSWMPVFHVNTPARWYSRIAKYAKKVNTVPVFLASFDPDSLRRALRDRWRKMPEWIISTRLDSDDALARDHIARVQSLADFTRREFLNFQLGWIWRRGQICIRTYPSNPFLSLIEQSECFQSCYCVPHPRAVQQRQLGRSQTYLLGCKSCTEGICQPTSRTVSTSGFPLRRCTTLSNSGLIGLRQLGSRAYRRTPESPKRLNAAVQDGFADSR